MRLINRRAKNKIFFLSGTILIFSAAMAVMYYAMR
jgi:hypothetical protein